MNCLQAALSAHSWSTPHSHEICQKVLLTLFNEQYFFFFYTISKLIADFREKLSLIHSLAFWLLNIFTLQALMLWTCPVLETITLNSIRIWNHEKKLRLQGNSFLHYDLLTLPVMSWEIAGDVVVDFVDSRALRQKGPQWGAKQPFSPGKVDSVTWILVVIPGDLQPWSGAQNSTSCTYRAWGLVHCCYVMREAEALMFC